MGQGLVPWDIQSEVRRTSKGLLEEEARALLDNALSITTGRPTNHLIEYQQDAENDVFDWIKFWKNTSCC